MTVLVSVQATVDVNGSERSFMAHGACVGISPEFFFPEELTGVNQAKRICRGCTVRRECLEYALTHREREGVWGGMSERERQRISLSRRTRSA